MRFTTSTIESADRLTRPNVRCIALPFGLGDDPARLGRAAGFGATACINLDEHPTCLRYRANETTKPRWAMRAATVAVAATLGVGASRTTSGAARVRGPTFPSPTVRRTRKNALGREEQHHAQADHRHRVAVVATVATAAPASAGFSTSPRSPHAVVDQEMDHGRSVPPAHR